MLLLFTWCRRPEEVADDVVLQGFQGNDILQRFKLNGQVALITGGDIREREQERDVLFCLILADSFRSEVCV